MTVYELTQELAYYPADADVSVLIGKDTKLDITIPMPYWTVKRE